MSLIRAGGVSDLEEILAIQAVSPEAAQWDPAGYLGYRLAVCIEDGRVAAFAVWRETAPDEREILNLAVAPSFRRRGLGTRLVEWLLKPSGTTAGVRGETAERLSVFLEVRESNLGARAFYKYLGFQEVSVRQDYYTVPPDSAIVMKFHSC